MPKVKLIGAKNQEVSCAVCDGSCGQTEEIHINTEIITNLTDTQIALINNNILIDDFADVPKNWDIGMDLIWEIVLCMN